MLSSPPSRLARAAAIAVLASLALARPPVAAAQTGLIRLEDATMPKPGAVRLRATNEWIRFDERLDGNGNTLPLTAGFAADSLGSPQLAGVTVLDNALRALTGDASSRVSLGKLAAAGDARVVVTPLSLELGLTRHLSFGVMLPIVQSRTTIRAQLNGDTLALKNANVGPNPADYTASAGVAADFSSAAVTLQARISQCQGSSDPSCNAINANPSGAAALAQSLGKFAAGVAILYGTGGATPGSPVTPLAGSSTLAAINANIGALNASYQGYVGSVVTSRTLGGAAVGGANTLLKTVLADPSLAGVDSVGAKELIWSGDMELSATYLLFDQLADSTTPLSGLSARAVVQGAARLPTGRVARGRTLYELGSGTGQPAVVGRIAADVRAGRRLGATIAGEYVQSFGSANVFGATSTYGGLIPLGPRTPMQRQVGSTIQIDATPRFALARYLTLDGYYSLLHRADDQYIAPAPSGVVDQPLIPGFAGGSFIVPGATEQRLGLGFAYSTLGSATGGVLPLPIEISFSHLTTLSASGGPALKATFDQVRVRLDYQVWGRR